MVSLSPPRLVVAAPASGHGKTTVATGLMAALRARGLAVSPHKVGPDYIDPGYHALATDRPGRNLDPVLCGEQLVGPLFLHGAAGADVAVVEGAMGLFDGRGATSYGSTAHVARLLGAPVLLVVDASSQGRSVAALVQGFRDHDRSVRLAGVVLNRVASQRHEEILRAALADLGVPVLGALRRDAAVGTPSRHLGLVPAAERATDAVAAVERLGALVADAVDVDAVLALAHSCTALPGVGWEPSVQPGPTGRVDRAGAAVRPRCVVAVAGGSAFTFSYAETTELLAAAGAEVAVFDPLRDEALPAGTRALVIGGGFPEMHVERLSANERLRAEVHALAASGAPVLAECAGLLYLGAELDGLAMCGVLDVVGQMSPRLTLGYREARAVTDSVLATAGATVRGHEFHRTTVEPGRGATPAWTLDDGRAEGFVQGGVHASYVHVHWAAHPDTARRLVAAAA